MSNIENYIKERLAEDASKQVREIDNLYPGLAEAFISTMASALNPDFNEVANKYINKGGEVTGRAGVRNGESTKGSDSKETPAVVLGGEGQYQRPNGEWYHSRKWGEHIDVEVLRTAREGDMFALLYGAPGCGKTALAEAAFGLDLYYLLGTGDTTVDDLVGTYVPTENEGEFRWVDGPLVTAAQEGKPFLIDEVGLIDPKVMSVCYSLMDGRRELVLSQNPARGTIKAQKGFYIVAATNPNAPGVMLSEALLSRFVIQAEMRTDWALAIKLGVDPDVVAAAQNLDTKVRKGTIDWGPQMRELLALRDMTVKFGQDWAISNLIAAAPPTARKDVAKALSGNLGSKNYDPAVI